jgi:hypothetical protein
MTDRARTVAAEFSPTRSGRHVHSSAECQGS